MDIRIGVVQSAREIELEMPEGTKPEDVIADVEKVLGKEGSVLWLTDHKGRRVGIPSARIAYVEVGTEDKKQRVGFAGSVKA